MSQLLFWRQYLRKPLSIGAVTPSGPKLARAVADALDPRTTDLVVELGPGTGVFTAQLLRDGIAPDKLVLIEFDRQFVQYLRQRYPGVTVIEGDARELPKLLAELGHPRVRKILSGLPLRSMKPRDRIAITRAVAKSLLPGGSLVQFSYFRVPTMPAAAAMRAGLHPRLAATVIGNIPPAFVWRYTRMERPAAAA